MFLKLCSIYFAVHFVIKYNRTTNLTSLCYNRQTCLDRLPGWCWVRICIYSMGSEMSPKLRCNLLTKMNECINISLHNVNLRIEYTLIIACFLLEFLISFSALLWEKRIQSCNDLIINNYPFKYYFLLSYLVSLQSTPLLSAVLSTYFYVIYLYVSPLLDSSFFFFHILLTNSQLDLFLIHSSICVHSLRFDLRLSILLFLSLGFYFFFPLLIPLPLPLPLLSSPFPLFNWN